MIRPAITLKALYFVLVLFMAGPAVGADIEIRGKVLGIDGLPYPEATVSLLPAESEFRQAEAWLAGDPAAPAESVKTGRSGEYLLTAPAAGHWTVRVDAPGATTKTYDLYPLVEPVVLQPVRLKPNAGLTVKVTEGGGKPVPGALVRLFAEPDRMMMMFRRPGWTDPADAGVTGEDGAVRLARVEGDKRELVISAAGYALYRKRAGSGTGHSAVLKKGTARKIQVVEESAGDPVPVPAAMIVDNRTGQPLGFTGDDGRLTVTAAGKERWKLSAVTAEGRRVTSSGNLLVLPDLDTMVGRLIDSATRAGIPGGLVWLEGRAFEAITTDRTGGFVLQSGQGSQSRIVADATGYLQSGETRFRFAGDGRPGPIIALSPAAAIEGTVLNAAGQGVPSASIDIAVRRNNPGMMVFTVGGSTPPRAVADEHGRYRISKVDPSRNYDVTASAEGYVKGKTVVMELAPGRTRSDVRIELAAGVRVTGTVLDPDGTPVQDALVTLSAATGRRMGGMMILDGSSPAEVTAYTGEDGRFDVSGLAAGNTKVEITRKGFARLTKEGIDLVAGPEATAIGPFTLAPGGAVQGIVLDDGGMPVADAQIRVAAGDGGGMGMMTFSNGPVSDDEPDALTGPDGWFTLEDQPLTGKLNLNVTSTGYLKGGAAVPEVPNLEPVTITLEPSLTFSGVVLDGEGEPVPGADLGLTRTMAGGAGGMSMMMVMTEDATADADGRFEFDGLEPGKISISGSAPGFQETKIEGIEMVKGENREGFELSLTPGAVLIGQVLAPDGKPAIDAAVGIVKDGPEPEFGQGPGRTATDGGGNYRLENLPPGPVSIEATHDSYVRTVRDIDATEGINSLDLQFEGGQQVTGSVTGPDGAPVPGASVRLVSPGRRWGGPQTDAGADGNFVLEGVSDGQYTLTAGAEGFAPPEEKIPVQVTGHPVSGLAVRLQATAVITGSVTGVDPSDYPKVEVNGFGGSGQFGDSRVDSEGRYRIEGLGAGTYNLRGSIGRSGDQAEAQAVLEPGQQEAVADLAFGQGVTLSGKAFLGEQPFTGAMVAASGTDVSHTGYGETEGDGSFRLSGLKPGNYNVQIRQWKTGISHEESVEIKSSREIELRIPTATVGGTVVDSADRRPLAGVRVSLAPPDGSVETFFGDRSAVTDLNGRFTVGNVADGSWTVWATKKGYATDRREIRLQIGSGPDDIRITLDPTEGLALEVRFPTGAIPDSVRAAVLDNAGRTMNSGSYATGENGSLRLSSVPRGSWDVVLYAPGAGVLSFRADAPGGPVPVILPRATAMTVRVPELAGDRTSATLTLTDSSGMPFRSLEWYGDPVDRWTLREGAWSSAVLPPGTWNITVQAADGRTWQGSGRTGDGPAAEVVLE